MTTETRSTSLPGGWILQAGPFAILAATAGYLRLHWDQLPQRFPVHWGIDGRPNGWSARTPAGVYGPLLLGAVILIGIGFMSYETMRRSKSTGERDTEAAAVVKRNIARRMGLFLAGLEFFLAGTFSWVGLLPLTGAPNVHVALATMAIFVGALAALAWGMNQAQRRDQAILASVQAHTDLGGLEPHEENWKIGMFYCNPHDPALWVEKRSGLGYTLNFAHAASWVLLAVLLFLPLGIALFAMWHR